MLQEMLETFARALARGLGYQVSRDVAWVGVALLALLVVVVLAQFFGWDIFTLIL